MSIAPRTPKTQQTPASEPVRCSTCLFFVPLAGWPRAGQCRRLPPNAHPTEEEFGVFPHVDVEWWCGEHSMFTREAKSRKAEQD